MPNSAPTEIIRKDGSVTYSCGERPPFEPGNAVAVRHGANSDRLVSERARTVLAELLERWPWLEEADGVAVDVLCRAKGRLDMLSDYADAVIAGETEAYPIKGRPRTGVEAVPDRIWLALAREERTVLDAAGKLGMTATDRASLAKDTGWARHLQSERRAEGVQELIRRGRGLRERREAEGTWGRRGA